MKGPTMDPLADIFQKHLSVATYHGVRALLEQDHADDPQTLAEALIRLDQFRATKFAAQGQCSECGRHLVVGQNGVCSARCANAEWTRSQYEQSFTATRDKARWAVEDATAVAAKQGGSK